MGLDGCRNAEAGTRSNPKDWPPPFLTHCDRGKPQGCLEPAKTVLKGKPHAFESWSGYLSLLIYIPSHCASSLYHSKSLNFWPDPASLPARKMICNLFSLFYALKKMLCLRKDQQRT